MLHADPMIRREFFDDPIAAEAAEPAVLFAAEGTVGEIIDRLIIHVGHAGLDPQRDAHASLDISREDRARQAVLRIVRHADRFFFAGHLDNGDDRAEHFLLRDLHLRRDIGEHMRR